jgi:hypothetical protein
MLIGCPNVHARCISERGCHGDRPLTVAVAVVRIFDWGGKSCFVPVLSPSSCRAEWEAEVMAPAATAGTARLARRLNEFPGARRQMILFGFAGREAPSSAVLFLFPPSSAVLFLFPPGASLRCDRSPSTARRPCALLGDAATCRSRWWRFQDHAA